MSSRSIRGPLRYDTYKLVTSGNYTVVNESIVVVNKTVGAATTITLPASLSASPPSVREVIVQDAKGDAGTNNITVVPAGADTINGLTSYVILANYGRVSFADAGGGNWVVNQSTGGTIPTLTATNSTITTETVTTTNATTANVGTLNVSGLSASTNITSYNSAGTVIGNATAIASAVNLVAGANNSAGVQLPSSPKGTELTVYSAVATNTLKIYPPVNGAINNGTVNAAFVATAQTPYYATCIDNSNNFIVK